jgi:hypothetical protein
MTALISTFFRKKRTTLLALIFFNVLAIVSSCKPPAGSANVLQFSDDEIKARQKAALAIPSCGDTWFKDRWDNGFFAPYGLLGEGVGEDSDIRQLVLSFITANGGDVVVATPTWTGTAIDDFSWNNKAVWAIEIISAMRRKGGDVMVSFGGANNLNLAQAVSRQGGSEKQLAAAYSRVVDYFKLGIIDFDIEGNALSDTKANQLHSLALTLLQQSHPRLRIWHTLPVFPQGLTSDGLTLVRQLLEKGVALSGINIMTMNYNDTVAPPSQKSMGAYAIDAALATHGQLSALFASHHQRFEWKNLGLTPMIGVNDVRSEVFTLDDAKMLTEFAKNRNIGMLSMWSTGRDRPGESIFSSSGINAPKDSFSRIFSTFRKQPGLETTKGQGCQ